MGRKQSTKTALALSLIGTPRPKDGKPHSPYSAAMQAGCAARSVYYYLKKQKTLEAGK